MNENMEDFRAQMTAMKQQSQEQTNDLKACLENIERPHRNDNGNRHDRHRNNGRNRGRDRNHWGNERDDDTDLKFEAGHDHRAHGRVHNPEDWVLKIVKVEAPCFHGRIDQKAYSDWESDMDHYFGWYEMSEERKVRFAKMKLVSQSRLYWIDVERGLQHRFEEPITC